MPMTGDADPARGTALPLMGQGLFLSVLGLGLFVLRGDTPWSWPSLDMATYYANIERPGAIAHDFFTSCFGASNGRALFGMLTAWPIRLGLGWYQTLYVWMLINAALMPMFLFLGIIAVLPVHNPRSVAVIFLATLVAILEPGMIDNLTVGWWRGWGNRFHPSVFSITILSAGVLLLAGRPMPFRFAGCALIGLSALVHPSYAIGGALFYAAIMRASDQWRRIGAMFGSVLIGLVVIKTYSASGLLSASDYDRYFSWLHPEHYMPSRFVSMGGFPWYAPAVVVLAAFAATWLLLRHQRRLAGVPLGFLAICGGALLIQYVLVELHPVSATILLISPVRFVAFGYWMLAVCVALLAGASVGAAPAAGNSETRGRGVPAAALAVTLVACAMLSILGIRSLGVPADRLSPDDNRLLDWIAVSTAPEADIASPGFLPVAIPLLTGRGTYHGNGFPFEDRCIAENYTRYVNIRGVPTGPRGRADSPRFYDDLDMDYLRKIVPRPDWVVMNRTAPGALRSITEEPPAYENDSYVVFRVN